MKLLIFGAHPESYSGIGRVCFILEKILIKNDIPFTHIATDGQYLPPKQITKDSVILNFDQVKTQLNELIKGHTLILTVGDVWIYEICCKLVESNLIPWIAYFGCEGQTYPHYAHFKDFHFKIDKLFEYITQIWTYTQHSKTILEERVPNKKIDILPHCVDVKRIKDIIPFGLRKKLKLPDKKLALFVGDNNARKGIDLFCQWLSTNNDYIGYLHTQRHRHIVGFDIDELKHIYKLDGRLFCKDDLKMHLNNGFLSELQLYGLYKDADLFLHPHRAEGFGLCVMEALVSKIPVLATDTAGPSTYLPKQCKIDTWQDYYIKLGGVGYVVQEPYLPDIVSKIKKGKGKHEFQPHGFDIHDFEKNLLALLGKEYEARKFFSA